MRRYLLAWWVIPWLCALTAASIIFFRVTTLLTYQPIISEGTASIADSPQLGINLNDERRLTQQFEPPAATTSHVTLGIANFRSASPAATVTIELIRVRDKTVVGKGQLAVSEIRSHELTPVTLAASFDGTSPYLLSVTTNGIAAPQSLTVFQESKKSQVPGGDAFVVTKHESAPPLAHLAGNIAFQVLRYPTSHVLRYHLTRSPPVWGLAAYCLMLLLLISVKKTRTFFINTLSTPLHLPRHHFAWKEVVLAALVGIALSLWVTSPYYLHPRTMATPIDLQRALVYRAVARDSLLQHGSLARWEPYLCGGTTLIGNMESVHLDPFFLLVLAFGEHLGLRLSVTATLILGFIGASLLARRYMNTSFTASLLAGTVFVFSGFQMLSFSDNFFAWLPIGWMPWLLLALLESMRRPLLIIPASIVGSFLLLGGSIHMTLYGFATAGLIAVFLALKTRQLKPLLIFLLIVMLTSSLLAIKLVPVTAVQILTAHFSRPPAFLPPLSWAPTMFLDRSPSGATGIDLKTGEEVHWLEYGTYIGWLPLVLAAASLLLMRQRALHQAVAATLVILLLMMFGLFPWTILHQQPLLTEVLRNAPRIRGAVVLIIGLLAASGLTALIRRLFKHHRHQQLLSAISVLFVTIDMITLHAPLFRQQFRQPLTTSPPAANFIRLQDSYRDNIPGYYQGYLLNRGTTDQCLNQLIGLSGAARGVNSSNPDKPYRGEAFLLQGGEAQLATLTPNKIVVTAATTQPDWLVLNQNYLPGWKTIPPREVAAKDGLVAARISPADTHLTFYYNPLSYRVGKTISLISLLLIAIVVIKHSKDYLLNRGDKLSRGIIDIL